MIFRDRATAGTLLAERLSQHRGQPDLIVLALPRGGVPVGAAIAVALGAPLDLLPVHRLAVPGHPERTLGAIASGGLRVLDEALVAAIGLDAAAIAALAASELEELKRRERLYRGQCRPPPLATRRVIVADDGLASGASMLAAVRALHAFKPSRLVVAVPVAAADGLRRIEAEVDEVVCLARPTPFGALAQWYRDFAEVDDGSVQALLQRAANPAASPETSPAQSS